MKSLGNKFKSSLDIENIEINGKLIRIKKDKYGRFYQEIKNGAKHYITSNKSSPISLIDDNGFCRKPGKLLEYLRTGIIR